MKSPKILLFTAALPLSVASLRAEPRLSSWLAKGSSQYARTYVNDAAKTAGTAVTTWTNQALPAYCGVQELAYSADWVYFRTSGLGTHTMGPWYLNAAHTQAFPNWPVNRKVLYRIPRNPVIPPAKTGIGFGAIGYSVDGVALFDSRDAFYWNGSAEAGGGGATGASYWRDAWPNEGVTFDPAGAHQEQQGTYHYHASPNALRFLLGDHVDYNPATKTYSESTGAVMKHSPILAWVRDGMPLYGPYGYSVALDANSGIRRMVSGYVLRNGQNGTDNISSAGRGALPQWALRAAGVSSGTGGPAVSAAYPAGRYTEDYAYLGDLTKSGTGQPHQQGADFDLNEFNVRWCVTPEFPTGTWAYFITLTAAGVPTYPYCVGRQYYGAASGGAVASITETVTTSFKGGPETQEMVTGLQPSGGDTVITWSSVEGGSYKVETGGDLTSWTVLTTSTAAARGTSTAYTENGGAVNDRRFYRVTRASLAAYDPAGATTGGGGGTNVAVPGGTAAKGATVTATITLPAAPPNPPADVLPSSVTLAGTIIGSGFSRPAQGSVSATFTIPANAAAGAQNVVIVFPGPGGGAGPTYTLTGALTIQ